jgi:hypothetical protein
LYAASRVRFRQVLVIRAFAHAQIRHRVEPQRVDAEIEPELHDVDHGIDDGGVVVVEIGLVRKKPVPVVLAGDRIVRPVRFLRVGEDDPRLGKRAIRVAPDVEGALGRSRGRAAGALEPGVLIGRVIDDQLDENPDVPRVRGADQLREIVERAVGRVDVAVVGDVVSVVAQRRRKEGEQPEARDADPLQVVELLRDALEIADAVVVAVEERLDVRLIDDRVLVPERIIVEIGIRRRYRVGRQSEIWGVERHSI